MFADGDGIGNWGTGLSSTVSDHGTDVVASALGRGTASLGKYRGIAPGAELAFYKTDGQAPSRRRTQWIDPTHGDPSVFERNLLGRGARHRAGMRGRRAGMDARGLAGFTDGGEPAAAAWDAVFRATGRCVANRALREVAFATW